MYYLKLQKEIKLIDRIPSSSEIHIMVDKQFALGSIIPIIIDRYIVSEGIVIDSNSLYSTIKIMTISDSQLIPTFEFVDDSIDLTSFAFDKPVCFGPTEFLTDAMPPELIKDFQIVDVRAISLQGLKFLVPDLFDYNGLRNLKLNVKFNIRGTKT